MTSEGHYAGRPPAEATSGGQAEPYGEDGFAPDSDRPGRAPANGQGDYPTSYAPPPQSTPNGGSPFVVPTVFGQSAPQPQPPAPPTSGGRPYPPTPSVGARTYSEPPQPPSAGGRPYPDAPQPPMAGGRAYPETPFAAGGRTYPERSPESQAGGRPYPEAAQGSFPAGGHPYPETPVRYQAPTAYPGQAMAPDAAERTTPPPFAPPVSGSARVAGVGDARSAGGDTPPVQRAAMPPRDVPPPPMPPRDVPPPPMPLRDAPAPQMPQRDLPPPPFRDGPAQSYDAPVSPRAAGSASVGGPSTPFGPRPGDSDRGGPAWGSPAGGSERGDDPDEAAGYPMGRPSSLADRREGTPFNRFTANRNAVPDTSPFERGAEPDTSRPAGPMFGDQRARVPGATLNGLPDAPPSTQPGSGNDESPPFGPQGFRRPGAQLFDAPPAHPFGAQRAPQDQPFGAQRRDEPFGQRAPEPPFGRPAEDDGFNAFGPADPPTSDDRRGPAGPDRPAGPGPAFGADRPGGPAYGTDRPASPGPSFGADRPGGPGFGPDRPASSGPSFGADRPASTGPGFGGADRAANPVPGFGADRPASPGPAFGADRPADPGPGFGANRPAFGGDRPGSPGPAFGADRPAGPGPGFSFGADRGPEPRGTEYGHPEQGGPDRRPGPEFGASAGPDRGPGPDFGASAGGGAGPDRGPMRGGFEQRVPGASLAASGMPVMANPRGDADEARNGASEPWNGSVPQPRDPAERSVVGTARAVSASASVPMASRVAPPDAEVAPRTSAPQPRVYGRAAPQVEAPEEPAEDPYPNSGAPTGRAAASARVGMPAAEPNAPGHPYAEPTTDVAGRGRAGGPPDMDRFGPPDRFAQEGVPDRVAQEGPPDRFGQGDRFGQMDRPGPADQFGERADDRQSYPQPFGPMGGPQPENGAPGHPYAREQRAMGGAFPGQVADETSTWQTPGEAPHAQAQGGPADWAAAQQGEAGNWPAQGGEAGNWPAQGGDGGNWPAPTSTWPPPGETPYQSGPGQQPHPGQDQEQGRFDQFAAEQPPGATSVSAKPETPHVRMLPILVGVIIAAVLVVGVALGVVWLISRGSDHGFSVKAGDCVKRSGNEAVKSNCSDPGSFQVVSIADNKDKCADTKQPYVVNPTKDGKSQVLCLKPSS